MSDLTYRDVLRILELIDAAEGIDLELDFEGTRIRVERRQAAPMAQGREVAPSPSPSATESPPPKASAPEASGARPASPVPEKQVEDEEQTGGVAVKAPMGGTFYAAPAPGASPFVAVGDAVREGQQIGIVEVMKLFTPVKAPRDGTVLSILVENQQIVAKDETLMRLGAE